MRKISKENRLLNSFKGIFCLLVVFIHVPFPGVVGQQLARLGNISVPFFFLISGWYSYYKNKNKEFTTKIVCKIKNILLLLLKSLSIYAILTVFLHVKNGSLAEWWNSFFNAKGLFKIFVMNNFSFIDLGEESWLIEILWFLPALIYCYLLLWLLVVCKGQVFGCILIPILLACRLVVMGSRANINWHYHNNFLLTGMPFVLLGYYLAINKERILSKKLLAINVFLLISGSLIVINKGGRDGYIGVIMVSIAVLCIAQLYPHRYIPVLETVGKKCLLKYMWDMSFGFGL